VGPLRVTISVGVATLGIDADDVAGLIEKADAALYEAKRQGRDRVAMAVPNHRASA
jgi:diguanylate cyclase (GGDEF)-like protein